MNPIEKILIPMLIIIGFIMLIFIGVKIFAIDSSVSSINNTITEWDGNFNK